MDGGDVRQSTEEEDDPNLRPGVWMLSDHDGDGAE